VNGFPGTAYPSVQAERNEVFVPLVSAVISVVLKKKVTNFNSPGVLLLVSSHYCLGCFLLCWSEWGGQAWYFASGQGSLCRL